MRTKIYKKTAGDHVFDAVVTILVICVVIITLYPFIYVISMTFSDPFEAARGNVYLFPKGFSLIALNRVLDDASLYRYYYNTLWYTLVGTVSCILVTCVSAYPLSRKEFKYRKYVIWLVTFTMFFGGGLIPTYIVITKFLKLYNSRLAIILPALTSAWYIIVTRSFFETLPGEIIESARIDGASEYRIFFQLIMPISKPVIAVIALYAAVGHWNSYMPAMLYLSKQELYPLAIYLRQVVIQGSMTTLEAAAAAGEEFMRTEDILASIQLKYAVIVVSTAPMLIMYPFVSGNLEKGLLVGALKG